MTSEEFLEEVMTSDFCPDNFRETYKKFNLYQEAALDTLLEFHRVCEKYNINYQLTFGSLLGAIRDGGQIPWDYDIDVFVPFEEKTKLVEVLKAELDAKYYFYCPEVNKKCRHVIMRLAPVEYRTEALHVDVFFYVGSPEDEKERRRYAKKLKKLSVARYWKLVNPHEESTGKISTELHLIAKKIPYLFLNLKHLEKKYNCECNRYSLKESSYYIEADTFADWYQFPRNYLQDTILYQTKNGTFRISSRYNEMLKLLYGDYMKIPKLSSRIREVMHHYQQLEYFNKKGKK